MAVWKSLEKRKIPKTKFGMQSYLGEERILNIRL